VRYRASLNAHDGDELILPANRSFNFSKSFHTKNIPRDTGMNKQSPGLIRAFRVHLWPIVVGQIFS
jgi:hypothetical protein